MDTNRYSVIIYYDPGNFQVHREIIAKLGRMVPSAVKRMGNMPVTGRLIIKRDTDSNTAMRLKKVLQIRGAVCRVKELAPVAEPSAEMAAARPDAPLKSSPKEKPRLLQCPNCGFRQSPQTECRSCGIIFSKARAPGHASRNEAPPVAQSKPRDFAFSGFIDKLLARAQPVAALLRKIQHPIGVERLTTWGRRVADGLIRCGLVLIIATILEIALLSLGKMLWYLYVSTPVGQRFVERLPEQAAIYSDIAIADPMILGWHVTLMTLYVGLLIGSVAQVLHIIRYLYDTMGVFGRLVLWYAPLVGLSAWIIAQEDPYPDYTLACTLAVIPALCMLSSCLHLARTAIPEIGTCGRFTVSVAHIGGDFRKRLFKKIRSWLDTTIQAR